MRHASQRILIFQYVTNKEKAKQYRNYSLVYSGHIGQQLEIEGDNFSFLSPGVLSKIVFDNFPMIFFDNFSITFPLPRSALYGERWTEHQRVPVLPLHRQDPVARWQARRLRPGSSRLSWQAWWWAILMAMMAMISTSGQSSLTRLVLLMMLGLRMLRIFKMLQSVAISQGGNRRVFIWSHSKEYEEDTPLRLSGWMSCMMSSAWLIIDNGEDRRQQNYGIKAP